MKLTREQIEQLLPDYVLGHCSENEKILFEESIIGYPELQAEVASAKSVFATLDKMDVNAMIDQRVKNLSVNVNSELQKSKTPFLLRKGFGRFVLPLVGAIGALILTFNNTSLQTTMRSMFSGGTTSENTEIFTTQDEQKMASILTSSTDESSLSSITESIPIEQTSVVLDKRSAVSITGMLDTELSELFTQPNESETHFNEATIEQRLNYETDQLETMIMEIEDAS
jgi:hypothetical protein